MELSFVLSALRRRFWLVAVCAFLGALPSLLTDTSSAESLYRSEAKLDIKQPTQGAGGLITDSNRYVISQISVLEGAELVDVVSRATNQSSADIRDAVTIEQDPDTDVVVVSAVSADPVIAQQVAEAYISGYMDSLETDNSDLQELDRLNQEIQGLRSRLLSLDEDIQAAMKPYLDRGQLNPPRPVPPPDYVVPGAVSDRDLTKGELADNIARRNELISDSNVRINTEIIQQATVPVEPLPQRAELLLAGGLLGGALLGVVAALAWARFSAKVLDEDTASEILGAPVVAEMPHYRSLARHPLAAFQSLPRSSVPVIDQLCVLAEARAHIDQPLAVVVVGSQRGAGATTLSLAMAERFATGGATVVLVDADVRDPRITAVFNASSDGGIPSVVANDGALIDQRGRSVFTRTMDPEVSVLGLGASRGQASLRRDTVGLVLEAARRKAQVVVIDGGPALDLASTLQFSALADAIVLAVPLARQKSDDLADLSRQLGGERQRLLPVVTSPSRRSARGSVASSTGQIAMPGLAAEPQPSANIDAAVTKGIATRQVPNNDQPRAGQTSASRGYGGNESADL